MTVGIGDSMLWAEGESVKVGVSTCNSRGRELGYVGRAKGTVGLWRLTQ